jgi:diacylglycerol O-acyltransferase
VSESYEPLSSMDAAILGIEDKTNLMMVSGVLTFAQSLDIDKLKLVLQERWLNQPRLRQRVVQPSLPMAWPYWEVDPNFNLNAHVHRVALPEPGDQAALQTIASDLISTPLDYSKPLWQIHVIEDFGGGGALLYRIHHVIGDGAALANLLMSMTDASLDAIYVVDETAVSPAENGQLPSAAPQLAKQVAIAAKLGRRFAKKVAIAGLDIVSAPEKTSDYINKGLAYTQSSLQLALKVLEPETVFSDELGVSKKVAWSRPFLLTELDSLRESVGGTLNDMMITILAGGLRRYMLAQGQSVHATRFRAAIPVSLRKNSSVKNLGNKFGVVFLSVPLSMSDPQERLAEVRARMDLLKESQDAKTVYNLVSAFSYMPAGIQSELVKQTAVLASAVITNVLGSTEARYLAGQKIENSIFWAPQSTKVGLGITIFSYDDHVIIGINTDPKVMSDPDIYLNCVDAEYEEMQKLVKGKKR